MEKLNWFQEKRSQRANDSKHSQDFGNTFLSFGCTTLERRENRVEYHT
jgi:hypothetical protein